MRTIEPEAHPYEPSLFRTTQDTTVRHYLSFQALAVTPDYVVTADNMLGRMWRSTAESLPGNLEGIRVPTLIVAATCSSELVLLEISFDHWAAKDKEFVGIEGADHNFQRCATRDGNTYQRTFDLLDTWLNDGNRFPYLNTEQAVSNSGISTPGNVQERGPPLMPKPATLVWHPHQQCRDAGNG